VSYRHLFERFLTADRLHFAAHSHHLWPDVTLQAHERAWHDAAEHADRKWDVIFGEVIPEAQRHIAGRLGLPDPATVAFAPNTHELVNRLVSSLPRPVRILTTDGEFHSFRRQTERWEERGLAKVVRVAVEPFETFSARFIDTAESGFDLVYLSHVFYNSGYAIPDPAAFVAALPLDPIVVVDGYHGFMALPTDVSAVSRRAFYVAGGYKYAMAGEGACFMHCPPGVIERPVNTGWFAGFGGLEEKGQDVSYPSDGGRFWGATFDPTGLYRFNAVQRMLDEIGLDVPAIHDHVTRLMAQFVAGLDPASPLGSLTPEWDPAGVRGHFLTFRSGDAAAVHERLDRDGVLCDRRGDRLRLGFGVYHDAADVDTLLGIVRHL
jgi:kynureninase